MNKLAIIFLCITVGLGSLVAGYMLGTSVNPISEPISKPVYENQIDSVLNNMEDGDEVVIEIGETGSYELVEGGTTHDQKPTYSKDYVFTRVLSWFGYGGPEAAVRVSGGDTSWNIWGTVKTVFWTYVIVLIVTGVLQFVPGVVGKVARPIFAILFGVITAGIALIENLYGKFIAKKESKKKEEVVRGGEAFKEAIKSADFSGMADSKIKETVLNTFKSSHLTTQSEETQKDVKKYS